MVIEADGVLYESALGQLDHQTCSHAGENGYDRFMNGLNLLVLQQIAGEKSHYEKHEKYEQRP